MTAEEYANTIDYERNSILTKEIAIDIFNKGFYEGKNSVPNDTELVDELQSYKEQFRADTEIINKQNESIDKLKKNNKWHHISAVEPIYNIFPEHDNPVLIKLICSDSVGYACFYYKVAHYDGNKFVDEYNEPFSDYVSDWKEIE